MKYQFALIAISLMGVDLAGCAERKGDAMRDVQHISTYIDRRPHEIYAFAADPRNLPRWAVGLANSEVTKKGNEWISDLISPN